MNRDTDVNTNKMVSLTATELAEVVGGTCVNVCETVCSQDYKQCTDVCFVRCD